MDNGAEVRSIIEEFQQKIERREEIDWMSFERRLKEIGIKHLDAKQRILSFYNNGEFVELCVAYARQWPSVELDNIK